AADGAGDHRTAAHVRGGGPGRRPRGCGPTASSTSVALPYALDSGAERGLAVGPLCEHPPGG
ncbi:hypothetical protein, partial [Streptomyces sp. SID6139]|uniref:hypothetical protein n=1 Tax=Streptomyces sp. SID6139 TaxID=2690320 RepID=UPI001F1D0689